MIAWGRAHEFEIVFKSANSVRNLRICGCTNLKMSLGSDLKCARIIAREMIAWGQAHEFETALGSGNSVRNLRICVNTNLKNELWGGFEVGKNYCA